MEYRPCEGKWNRRERHSGDELDLDGHLSPFRPRSPSSFVRRELLCLFLLSSTNRPAIPSPPIIRIPHRAFIPAFRGCVRCARCSVRCSAFSPRESCVRHLSKQHFGFVVENDGTCRRRCYLVRRRRATSDSGFSRYHSRILSRDIARPSVREIREGRASRRLCVS